MSQTAIGVAAVVFLGVAGAGRSEPTRCPPQGYTRAYLKALATRNFEVADDAARNALALTLTGCLTSADPRLRDGIAFEALSHFMRSGELRDETMLELEQRLVPWLVGDDPEGFRRPFAALTLSELARADRIRPYLPEPVRTDLLAAAIRYLKSVSDYRGFDDKDGWRHGVAHGSDLVLQLSMNPAFARPEMERMLDAVATQIAPRGHFYMFGEPGRLARPVLTIAQRGVFSQVEWTAWLARVTAPTPFPNWAAAFESREGLARVHDVTAFVQGLYVAVRLSSDKSVLLLLPGVEQAARALP